MPAYDYTCPKCNTRCTRIVSYEKRDTQTCEAQFHLSPVTGELEGKECANPLERDEIGLSARMPHQWSGT